MMMEKVEINIIHLKKYEKESLISILLKINPPLIGSWYNNNVIDINPKISSGLIHFLNDIKSNRIIDSANIIIRNSGKKYCILERLSINYIKEFIIEIRSPIANLTILTRGSG